MHNAIGGLPNVMKVRGRAGILVEDGVPGAAVHEDEALEAVFFGESVKRVRVSEGRH